MQGVRAVSAADLALSATDRAFLAWDAPRRPMHVALLVTFHPAPGNQPPSIEAVHAALDATIRGEPRLLARPVHGPLGRRPRLVAVTRFAIEDHVRIPSFAGAARGAAFERELDALLARPLDLGRPAWEIWMLPAHPEAGAFTLACKFHHALLDGASGVALLERIFGATAKPRELRRAPRATRARRDGARLLRVLKAGSRLLRAALRRGPATELNGAVGSLRRHRALHRDLATLDAGAAELGGTRNDALLAAVAGALRASLDGAPAGARAFCPVDMRARGDRRLGNRISLWIVDLPLAEPDAASRVRRMRERTLRAKRGGDAAGGQMLERIAAALGSWTARLGMTVAAWLRVFQIVVTNVSGPARPLSFLGATLASIVPFAPLFPGQRVAVAAISYGGELHLGICDGFASSERGERFAAELARELDDIAAHAAPVPLAQPRSA